MCVAAGIALPAVVLLLIIVLPKRALETDAETPSTVPTDNYLIKRILITVAMGLVMISLAAFTFGMKFSVELVAVKIDSLETADMKEPKNDVEMQTLPVTDN